MSDSTANFIARPTADIQHAFATIMPRIVLHAKITFRHVSCDSARQEAIAETIALAWKWFVRLIEQGKEPQAFISVLAAYAARAVKSGRRLCGQEKSNDVLSPLAQSRRRFTISPYPQFSTHDGNAIDEALHDNTQTPIPEQVSFRVDFPAWLATRTDRDREIISELMVGERTLEVSKKYRVSQPRISQLRREYQEDWKAFCEPADSAVV